MDFVKWTPNPAVERTAGSHALAAAAHCKRSAACQENLRTAYLETSAVNQAVDAGLPGAAARSRLQASGLSPVIGLHVIYELARTFLKPTAHDRAKTLFSFLQDLDPSYASGSSDLMSQEMLKLRTGAAVLPFLDHLNQAATRAEVSRLAAGTFDAKAHAFITRRETELRANHPAATMRYLDSVAELRARNPEAAPKFRTFEDAKRHLAPKIPELIRNVLQASPTQAEAEELAARLDSFPALLAAVNANLYLMLICISQGAVPAAEHLDDYRHAIEGAYCAVLLTADGGLLTVGPQLNPAMEYLRWPQGR